MTERKPAGLNFTSWIDQQISEAAERGAFDDLPGAGLPLPQRSDAENEMAWIRDKLAKEGVSADELLPPPLRLRKERQQLIDNVAGFTSERAVAEAVSDLNRRIAEWRRIPVGPPIHVSLLGKDEMIARWRESRPTLPAAATPVPSVVPAASQPRRRRWWSRRDRPGST